MVLNKISKKTGNLKVAGLLGKYFALGNSEGVEPVNGCPVIEVSSGQYREAAPKNNISRDSLKKIFPHSSIFSKSFYVSDLPYVLWENNIVVDIHLYCYIYIYIYIYV